MKKHLLTYLFPLLLALIISVPVILPYFHSGYFSTHDGEWAVVRLADMFREIRDHQFPPRFSGYLNFGYGYPLFNFAYPFPYYLGVLLHFLKIGFVDSIKLLFAISVPLSALCMFFASRRLWKSPLAGFASAVFFIYFPYRIVDLYARGSLGESLAFVLFPAIFFFILRVLDNPYKKEFMALIAFSYAALILTHNIMAVFFSIILVLFLSGMFFIRRTETIRVMVSLIGGLGIAAFFWVPAILEKQYILLAKIPITDRNLYYVTIEQLLIPRWGYGTPTDTNGFSYQLGLPHIIILLLTAVVVFFVWVKKRNNMQHRWFSSAVILFVTTLFFLFLLFRNSAPLWKLPFLSEINYPWTLLGPLGFLCSLLSGFLVTQRFTKYVVLLLAGVSILFVLPYAKPQYYVDRGDNFYITNEATTTSSNELMPLWVKKMPNMQAKQKVEIVSGEGQVSNVVYNSKIVRFNITADKPLLVKVNTIYYPGWKAKIDEVNTVISYNNDMGIMQIALPMGNHIVSFSFTETPLRLASDIISVASIVILLSVSIFHLGGGLARTPRKNGGFAT